jgi:hypothetical protein
MLSSNKENWPSPFRSGWHFFLSFALMFSPSLPILYWIGWWKWTSFSCSWSYRKWFQLFPIHYNVVCGFDKLNLYCAQLQLFYTWFLRIFIIKGCWILSNAFLHLGEDHRVFVLHSADIVYYIYWFPNIEPSLHCWDKSHLVREVSQKLWSVFNYDHSLFYM